MVKRIPSGRVSTYGDITRALGMRDARKVGPRKEFSTRLAPPSRSEIQRGKWAIDPRMVGWALHANKDDEVPCHRVVDRNGRLAPNFAFDGWREQRRRLEEEGVAFVDENHVDMRKYHWHME